MSCRALGTLVGAERLARGTTREQKRRSISLPEEGGKTRRIHFSDVGQHESSLPVVHLICHSTIGIIVDADGYTDPSVHETSGQSSGTAE
jgi:hypothetical protein